MITLKKTASELLLKAVEEKFGKELLSADEIFSMLEYPPDKSMGDVALPCFRLSKVLRRSPVQIAEALGSAIASPAFSEVSAISGYLNFKIDEGEFAKRVISDISALGEKYGSLLCAVRERPLCLTIRHPTWQSPSISVTSELRL